MSGSTGSGESRIDAAYSWYHWPVTRITLNLNLNLVMLAPSDQHVYAINLDGAHQILSVYITHQYFVEADLNEKLRNSYLELQ